MNAKSLFLACILLVSFGSTHALQPPAGWNKNEANGAHIYTPADLQPGEFVQVITYARASLVTETLEAWLKRVGEQDTPPEGKWAGVLSIKPQTKNLVSGTRAWSDAKGKQGAAVYTAVSVDGLYGRIGRLLVNDSPAMQRHRQAAMDIMSQLGAEEIVTAKKEDRATDIEAQPPVVDNIKAGGPLSPGRYVGNLASNGKVLRRIDVLLFPNGEYEFLQGAGSSASKTGKFKYTEASGKLNVDDPLWNSTYHPDEDFCIYGRNAKGEYVIYAEDDYGVGTFKTLLTRVGEVDRIPPTQAKQQEAAEKAEAARYKWVTQPGKGLAAKDIEAIVYRWEQIYEIGGLQMHDYSYLLLKDGTAHQGVPVAPEDMDVAASKKNEPKTWGRWRKNGGAYEFAWADAPEQFAALRNAHAVTPAAANARLEGRWNGASSYQMPGGAGSWSKWGVTFSRDGKFEKYHSGGVGSGQMGELSGTGVTTGAVYDDEGSASVVIGPNFGGGSTSKSGKTKADRSGTYALNGYTLELRYDNGAVVRLPFFFSDKDDSMIWFEGSTLMRDKGSK